LGTDERRGLQVNYGTIYADPPWKLTGGKNGKGGWSKTASPDVHYPLMKLEDILALPVSDLALPDAHLWLWVPNSMLPQGLEVMEEWGFEYKNNLAWIKEGAPGLGQYMRTMHEICLFGKRGHTPYSRRADGKRDQPVSFHTARRGRHSEKPPAIRNIIKRVSPGPYLELFARKKVEGWDAWGNEVKCDVVMEAPPAKRETIQRECETCGSTMKIWVGSTTTECSRCLEY
jgi:N6-adenosine-specific RNA methylase IME4